MCSNTRRDTYVQAQSTAYRLSGIENPSPEPIGNWLIAASEAIMSVTVHHDSGWQTLETQLDGSRQASWRFAHDNQALFLK